MKKIIKLYFVVMLIVLYMCACDSNNSPKAPFDVYTNGDTISYGDTREQAEKVFGKGEDSKTGFVKSTEYDKSIRIVYTDDRIRCIEIIDSDVITYNSITVDTSIKDVLKQYQFEQKQGSNYAVAFSDGIEINVSDAASIETVDCWITYYVEDDKVSSIQIYDSKFAKEMR